MRLQRKQGVIANNSGFGEEQCYVSYGHGDEKAEVLYGERKLGRLRELKATWDPANVFGFNESFED